MPKKVVSKEEYKQTVDEILRCHEAITKAFDEYTANAIDRLIIARIKLETITIDHSKIESVLNNPKEKGSETE